jgi:hypothetical protein
LDLAGKFSRIQFLFGSIFLTLLVAGCSVGLPLVDPTETLSPTLTSTATPTEVPTSTATPLAPIGLLLAPTNADARLVSEVQSRLSQWIPEMGYRFQIRQTLSEADLARYDFRLVVALPPNAEIASLAASHPEIHFMAVGLPGLEARANLTTIGADGERLDHQGFLAGYMAAMITPDWRVGVIGYSDSARTVAARQAFFSGVKFYCGLCLPDYPPYYEYPLYFELGSDADTVAWRTAADYMIHRSVGTVYVVPGAGDDAMLQHLADAGVNIIAGRPQPSGLEDHWVASLTFDLLSSFLVEWPLFSTGTTGQAVTLPLQIMDANPELLSPGKQQLVEKMLADVLAGFVDLGLDIGDNPK